MSNDSPIHPSRKRHSSGWMAEKTARTVASIITGIGLAIGAVTALVVWAMVPYDPDGLLHFGLRVHLVVGVLTGLTIARLVAWLVTGSFKSTDPVEEPCEPSKSTAREQQAAADWLEDLH